MNKQTVKLQQLWAPGSHTVRARVFPHCYGDAGGVRGFEEAPLSSGCMWPERQHFSSQIGRAVFPTFPAYLPSGAPCNDVGPPDVACISRPVLMAQAVEPGEGPVALRASAVLEAGGETAWWGRISGSGVRGAESFDLASRPMRPGSMGLPLPFPSWPHPFFSSATGKELLPAYRPRQSPGRQPFLLGCVLWAPGAQPRGPLRVSQGDSCSEEARGALLLSLSERRDRGALS